MASQTLQPNISAIDRLGFTVFLALAVHAIIVLTDFIQEDPEPAPLTLEITLSQYSDDTKPEQADFLAQTNQLGSGDKDEKSEITVTQPGTEQAVIEQELVSQATKKPLPEAPVQASLVSTVDTSPRKTTIIETQDDLLEFMEPQADPVFLNNNINWQIQQLEATLDDQVKNYAKRPRVTRLTASSTMQSSDASYVQSVVRKIERIGKLHFPTEAGKKLYGKPRVAISIYADGSIKSVEVLQSSGNLVLDSKTKDIVHRAGPFAPFPKEVRRQRDVLELIRTFSYDKKGLASF